MLRRMTWSREDGQPDLADRESVAIADRIVVELQPGVGTRDNRGASHCRDLTAAGDEVVVDMRLADVSDAHALGVCHRLVLVDVAERVDQYREGVSLGDQQMCV